MLLFKPPRSFVSPYEEEFKSFYDSLFYPHINALGNGITLHANYKAYTSPSTIVYWLLTTDDIDYIEWQDSQTKISVNVNKIIINTPRYTYLSAKTELTLTGEFDLDQIIDKSVVQQLLQLRQIKMHYNGNYEFLSNCARYQKDSFFLCEKAIDILNDENTLLYNINNRNMTKIFYDVNGVIVQYKDVMVKIFDVNEQHINQIKEFYKNKFNEIIFDDDFVVIIHPYDIQIRVTKIFTGSITMSIIFKIALYPLYYYSHTIGYELGILDAYFLTSKTIGGFEQWLERWQVNTDEDDYDKVKKSIYMYAFSKNNIIYH